MGTGAFVEQPTVTDDYRQGYLRGMVDDSTEFHIPLADIEAMDRTQEYLDYFGVREGRGFLNQVRELAHWQIAPNPDWLKGFLAGAFDYLGTCSRSILRMSSRNATVIEAICLALKHFDFDFAIEELRRRRGVRVVRLRGGLRENLRFFHTVDPAITRKRDIDGVAIKSQQPLGVVSVEPLEEMALYDITTGTGDFIANGVVSHNCFARKTHYVSGPRLRRATSTISSSSRSTRARCCRASCVRRGGSRSTSRWAPTPIRTSGRRGGTP